MKRNQQKAIHASYRDSVKKADGFDRVDLMASHLKEHRLLNPSMRVKDIAYSHKKNFGGIGVVPHHVNKNHTPYLNSIPISQTKSNWEKMTQKQKYEYLRPSFTDEWAKMLSKKSWSQLDKQQQGSVAGREIDKARHHDASTRDATRFHHVDYHKVLPKGDKRIGRQHYHNGKYVEYR